MPLRRTHLVLVLLAAATACSHVTVRGYALDAAAGQLPCARDAVTLTPHPELGPYTYDAEGCGRRGRLTCFPRTGRVECWPEPDPP